MSRRTRTSATIPATAVACVCAFGLHLAFPLSGWWLVAPFAAAGLIASWSVLAPRQAALAGYASGLVFFSFGFSWFGETAGALVGRAAPLLVLGPAAIEALAFCAAAVVASFAARRCDARAVPLVAAAAFTLAEQLRSSGPLGVPFSQLGVAMINSPLRPLAAYFGGYGITFAVTLLGASLGWWLLERSDELRARAALTCWLAVFAVTAVAWALWPARSIAPPSRIVAAVQGGIAQTVKRSDGGLALAIQRYTMLTRTLRAAHPTLVLWPETVITEDYSLDAARPLLGAGFASLARELGATLFVGTLSSAGGGHAYNALRIYRPKGGAALVYRKEQLVPFTEYVPGPQWLRSLPLADQIGAYTPGTNDATAIDGATPLICWESMFADIAHERLRDAPSLLLIATDDAWFGTTQGPYEHADAAALRAVETGRWVLQAAATGISGIVAPNGRWTQRTTISEIPATVSGAVGAPAPALFARLGPTPIGAALLLATVLPFVRRSRRR